MAKTQTDAVWVELDPQTLDAQCGAAYTEYKAFYAKANEARKAFEGLMNDQADLPDGQKMVFGYRFGKLSVAIVADEGKPAKAGVKAQSLSAYLANQRAQGR